jgi:hypothetical protein
MTLKSITGCCFIAAMIVGLWSLHAWAQTGNVDSIPIGDSSPMGPLTVHSKNPRYFAGPDGRAVWLTGSHTWATVQERGVEGQTPDFDFDGYLDFMQQHGHNFLRLWVWEHAQWMQFADADVPVRYKPMIHERTGPGTALDGQPKFDLTKFNDDFFERLRQRVAEAGRRDVYVSVMFFQGFSVRKPPASPLAGNNWHGNPFHKANNINGIDGDPSGSDTGHELHTLKVPAITRMQEAYVRRVIDTLSDLDNVVWEIGNELPPSSVDFQYHMIRVIREYERTKPKQHLIGMTGAPVTTKDLLASTADWISPPGPIWVDHPPAADGNKLMVVDTDHCRALRFDPDWVWKNFTRGNHFLLMDEYQDFRAGSPKQPNPKWDETRDAMGAARRLSEKLDLASMKPRPDLASSQYCLADLGRLYIVFSSGEGTLTVHIGRGRWHAIWVDSVTGIELGETMIDAATETVTFQTPQTGSRVLKIMKLKR